MTNKVYDIITQKIIDELESGNIPWKKPWTGSLPMNIVTKKPYNGINLLLLSITKHKSPYYLTFKQAKNQGGKIKKGEHGYPIVYWTMIESGDLDEKTKEPIEIPLLRYYTVFNLEQTEGIKAPKTKKDDKVVTKDHLTALESVLEGYKGHPEVVSDLRNAYYDLKEDRVGIPSKDKFDSVDAYFATLYHELIHSTGHTKRLKRFEKDSDAQASFGSESYSKEELVAELGSAYLSARVGVDNSLLKNSAGYIQGWLKRLNNDKKLLISASSKAMKATNYILNEDVPLKTGSEVAN